MTLDNFYSTTAFFQSIISEIESIEFTETKTVAKLKSKIRLKEGSVIYLREIYIKGLLIDYSYYWFDVDEKLKIGWDNAPHHPELSTFPHHKHYLDKVAESDEKTLTEVLEFVSESLIA
ncbi:MAG: DUF6516 family protein [Cytophagales bacterium]